MEQKRKQFVRSDAVDLDQKKKKIIRSNAFDYETPNLSSSFDTKMSEKVTQSQRENAPKTKRKLDQRSTKIQVDMHTKDKISNDDDPRLLNDMKSFMELHPLKVKVAASTEDLLFLHESF